MIKAQGSSQRRSQSLTNTTVDRRKDFDAIMLGQENPLEDNEPQSPLTGLSPSASKHCFFMPML
jgi:hypothetical protein